MLDHARAVASLQSAEARTLALFPEPPKHRTKKMQEPHERSPDEGQKKGSKYLQFNAKILPKHKRKLALIMKTNRLDNLSQALRFMLDESKF